MRILIIAIVFIFPALSFGQSPRELFKPMVKAERPQENEWSKYLKTGKHTAPLAVKQKKKNKKISLKQKRGVSK